MQLDYTDNKCLYFCCFFVLGVINDNGMIVISTAAHEIAEKFERKNLMPAFQICFFIFSTTIQLINSRFL